MTKVLDEYNYRTNSAKSFNGLTEVIFFRLFFEITKHFIAKFTSLNTKEPKLFPRYLISCIRKFKQGFWI